MTETGGLIASQYKNTKRNNSVGYLHGGGIKMKVVNVSTGNVLGPNQEGELCFKLDYPMLGYYKNPKESKKAIDDEGTSQTLLMLYY